MTCNEWQARLLEGETSPGLDAHLESCVTCRRARADLAVAAELLADPATWERPSDDLEDRVVAAIRATATPASPDRDVTRRRVLAAIAGVAALIAIVLGVRAATRPPAPDWTAPLAAAQPGSTASATVAGWNMPEGTRVVLDVADLAPAPPGTIYELWFTRPGAAISAGTFRTGGTMELSVGVPRKDYPTILITLEPLEGTPGPSNTVVMTSTDA